MLGDIGRQRSKIWFPDGFQGVVYTGEEALIMVAKGARLMAGVKVSTDWLVLGWGVIGHCIWPLCQPWCPFVWSHRFSGSGAKT